MVRLRIKKKIKAKIEKKHGVSVREVYEVFGGRYYLTTAGRRRYKVIGKTRSGRFLTLIIDKKEDIYELVTARDSTDSETRLYKKKIKQ